MGREWRPKKVQFSVGKVLKQHKKRLYRIVCELIILNIESPGDTSLHGELWCVDAV